MPMLRFCSVVCLKVFTKTYENLKILDVQADVLTRKGASTKQKCWPFNHASQCFKRYLLHKVLTEFIKTSSSFETYFDTHARTKRTHTYAYIHILYKYVYINIRPEIHSHTHTRTLYTRKRADIIFFPGSNPATNTSQYIGFLTCG